MKHALLNNVKRKSGDAVIPNRLLVSAGETPVSTENHASRPVAFRDLVLQSGGTLRECVLERIPKVSVAPLWAPRILSF